MPIIIINKDTLTECFCDTMISNIIERQIKENRLICPECGEPLGEDREFDKKEDFIKHLADNYTDHVFEHFWNDKKKELKQLSKKEIAEEAFFQSIANFLHNFIPDKKKEKDDISNGNKT